MPKLKLPRLRAAPTGGELLPPELRWDAPPVPSALVLLSRREFLKALAVLLAALTAPVTGGRRALAVARGRFFTSQELATLEALCDRIIPPDTDAEGRPSPGARDLGAPTYIEGLLTAFEHTVPRVYAGGPFSGRNPLPDHGRGIPSRERPRDSFKRFLRLPTVQDIRWRAEIFGSASPEAPGADFGDAARGPLKGLRDLYREGLAKVDQVSTGMAGAPYVQLSTAEQDRVLGLLDAAFAPDPRRDGMTFMDILIGHTIEGCFSAPEYGGNLDGQGWEMVGLEGDSQPLGYSIFSRDAGAYRERTDHPMSTPNPDELAAGVLTPRPLSADGAAIQTVIAQLSTLGRFARGACEGEP